MLNTGMPWTLVFTDAISFSEKVDVASGKF
mgnify:CR=1 FL=1